MPSLRSSSDSPNLFLNRSNELHFWRDNDPLALQPSLELALLRTPADPTILHHRSHLYYFHSLIFINVVKFFAGRWRFADPTTAIGVYDFILILHLLFHPAFDPTTIVGVDLLPHHLNLSITRILSRVPSLLGICVFDVSIILNLQPLSDSATILSSLENIDKSCRHYTPSLWV